MDNRVAMCQRATNAAPRLHALLPTSKHAATCRSHSICTLTSTHSSLTPSGLHRHRGAQRGQVGKSDFGVPRMLLLEGQDSGLEARILGALVIYRVPAGRSGQSSRAAAACVFHSSALRVLRA